MISTKQPVKFTCYLIALLGGFSRIYLSQHFPEDVLVGSIVGVLSTLMFCLWKFPLRMKWSNKSLRRL